MAKTFNENELLDRVDNDLEFLAETVQILQCDGQCAMDQIREAIAAGDAPSVGRAAHALKGIVSNFCSPQTQASALAVEQMGKSGDLSAAPEVVIWEDPTWEDPSKATPELFELSHVLCPNLPMWIARGQAFADFYLQQRREGRRLWFYSCSGPGRLLDPYSYHRMQHWFCWKYGAEGSGFWAFGDSNGASSWNEYASQVGAFTPLFLDTRSVTPGKHMEAIREGIEDFEYLRMLRDRVEAIEKQGVRNSTLALARKLLDAAAGRVTGCMTSSELIHWKEPKDRAVADRVRVEILETLTQLAKP